MVELLNYSMLQKLVLYHFYNAHPLIYNILEKKVVPVKPEPTSPGCNSACPDEILKTPETAKPTMPDAMSDSRRFLNSGLLIDSCHKYSII
jgi:hypothetical protein